MSTYSPDRVDPGLVAGNRRTLAGYRATHFQWQVDGTVGAAAEVQAGQLRDRVGHLGRRAPRIPGDRQRGDGDQGDDELARAVDCLAAAAFAEEAATITGRRRSGRRSRR